MAASLAIYLAVKDTRDLRAIVYESLAQEIRPALMQNSGGSVEPDGASIRRRCRDASELVEELKLDEGNRIRNAYLINILNALIGGEALKIPIPGTCASFLKTWSELFEEPKKTTKESSK